MFNCPKCGMSSEPKEELVGGDIFGNGGAMRRVCAFCGWELPDGVGSPSKVRHDSPKRRHACPDALDELFGDDSGVDDGKTPWIRMRPGKAPKKLKSAL